ncbi:protein FAM8A1 [Copidosoma floridanum]|uniref:protein FAM8A1 n=1 Tax=Copidosoma floridanum TaxID=29053 RepID=UPI0006C9B1E4|nr:protein FAM8A1 [Copidosoma floridanum]
MAENVGQSDKEEAGGSGCVFTSKQRTEYFDELEKWLLDAYAWHSFVASFPYLVTTSQMLHAANPAASSNVGATTANADIPPNSQTANYEGAHQRRVTEPAPVSAAALLQPGVTGVTYKIPPVWKRLAAEFIDSMLLFILKLSITFIAVDVFDFINFERYYLDMLHANLKIDYKMALELTSGLLVLELIHRIFVCIFEASWLQHGRNGRVGGATPGKSIMKLKVVLCQSVTSIGRPEDELVLVVPGTDLGLLPALGRSLLKNLILAFFVPICFVLCFFKYNRTIYDIFCNSIVVEDSYRNGNNNIYNDNNNNFNNNNINNQRVHQD